MMTAERSRRPLLGVVFLALLLFVASVVLPISGGLFRMGSAGSSSRVVPALDSGFGGQAVTVLFTVYNERPDLQTAFPDAATDFTQYTDLVTWAGGTVTGQWTDHNYQTLAPFGYWYALMATYNARPDLQAAFPQAYTNYTSYTDLVNWADAVVAGLSADGAYSSLAPFGYWYALMATYNARPDLQTAFPQAYTNLTNYTELVGWAADVVSGQSNDGAYSALAPFAFYYELMGTYNARPDLQTAFPQAYTNFTNYTELVGWAADVVAGQSVDGTYSALVPSGYYYELMASYNARADLRSSFPEAYTNFDSYSELVGWAGEVVSGTSTDGAYASLAPFGYYYVLLAEYNARSDLQSAFPAAYTSFGSYAGLVGWAGDVVTGSSADGASAVLSPFGYYFALMSVYNGRSDLQSALPDAYTDFASYSALVDWAGEVVTGAFYDGAYSSLAPFGYFYDMMGLYDSRPDLQTAFPLAYSDWASEQSLASWAGAVVNYSISDPSQATLQPFGYWYVLYGWVYEPRSDLQSQFPLAWTEPSSNQGLLGWAKEVVNGEIVDPAFLALDPFSSTYDTLG